MDGGDAIRPLGNPAGVAAAAAAAAAAAFAVAAAAARDAGGSELGDSHMLPGEDGELSYYEESQQHYDAYDPYDAYEGEHAEGGFGIEDSSDLPMPLLAPRRFGVGGIGAAGSEGLEVSGGAAAASSSAASASAASGGGRASGASYTSGSGSYLEEGSDSDGWVDQYTNSSLGGSRDDLMGVMQVPSVSSLPGEQWRKARLTPAV